MQLVKKKVHKMYFDKLDDNIGNISEFCENGTGLK